MSSKHARKLTERVVKSVTSSLEQQRIDLLAACESALSHIQELEDAWMRGAIHDIDGKGAERSNRNKSVEVMLRKIIATTKGEPVI